MNLPLVVSGPSGAGKSTLISKLFQKFPNQFAFSVSYTTRPPRPQEQNGLDYYFISHSEFLQKIQQSSFIEHCQVHQNLYGTSRLEVEKVTKSGKICLLDIDVQGALKIAASQTAFNGIFIRPSNLQTLETRLRVRNTDSESAIQTRLANAKSELEIGLNNLQIYKHVIVNDNLSQATQDFFSTICSLYPTLTSNVNPLI